MVKALHDGYLAFRKNDWPIKRDLYRHLAHSGQSPRVMVIACCDSRADPALIFNANPGDLFVVRNVANLVPPFESNAQFHGTSSAIEFAVTGLGVEHILVMGHAQCGGIAACLDDDPGVHGHFTTKWMSSMAKTKTHVLETCPKADHHTVLEHEAVRQSLENLATFPFVAERVKAGTLGLFGAWFDIENGELEWLDQEQGCFRPAAEYAPI